jgi:hypothetical protein
VSDQGKGESDVMMFVCGGKDDVCPGGGEHDDLATVKFDNGAGSSVSCSKCGSSAYERDLMRLP